MQQAKRAKSGDVPTALLEARVDKGYVLYVSRTAEITAIDMNMFTDMRPNEQSDALDELKKRATVYAIDGEGCLGDNLDGDGQLPQWVLDQFIEKHGLRWWAGSGADFEMLEEANRAAKDIVELALTAPIDSFYGMKHVAVGDETIQKCSARPELYRARGGVLEPGSDGFLARYTVPPSDTEARQTVNSNGLATYTASFSLYCDPFGAELYNVVRVTFTCRVATGEEAFGSGDELAAE
eukprot:CAMPEP_0119319266 /NCGR_PEP_ID=MMETSP1333-20130426/48925_1 /TAXON_ID=418940 /ORGANISM="Scyphosphaera apsteinii, Strain RCC1455" /LENGTH=237 /DNA_ID=CAMNT_0007325633 /DNA_START=54 /DNA_END=767 /DNA_ORIENTATION=+